MIHYWLYHITIHYSFWLDLLLIRHENPTLSARLKTQCAQKTLPKGKRDLGFDSLIDSSGFHGKVSRGIEWDALTFLWFRMFRESCFLSETKPIFTYIWNRPGEEHELPEHTARQCKSMNGYEWNIHPFGQICRQNMLGVPAGTPWKSSPHSVQYGPMAHHETRPPHRSISEKIRRWPVQAVGDVLAGRDIWDIYGYLPSINGTRTRMFLHCFLSVPLPSLLIGG